MQFDHEKEVVAYITGCVMAKIASGQIVDRKWLTLEVLSNYSGIEGEHADHYRAMARRFIDGTSRRVIGKLESANPGQSAFTMEGYEHLQMAYPLKRKGELVLVPVEQADDEELEGRALEYESMAEGALAHAAEIRRYIELRRAGDFLGGAAA
jgi:hypothetical protein